MNIFETALIQPLANGLALFYQLLGQNMGLAIIGFSLVLRSVLTPLTKPYMESVKKMKEYAPQLNKLKKKYKDDRQKLLQAQADFYKSKGINPGGGCLPYLLQFVILIAFIRVFTRILSPEMDILSAFNELLYGPLKFSADAVINTRFLYLDLTKPDVINISGLPFPLPGPFVILAAFTQFVSVKIMSPVVEAQKERAKATPEASDDMQTAIQRTTVYTMPLLTLIFGINFSSGLILYWFTFSLFQTVQQFRSEGLGGLEPIVKRIKFW